MNLARLTSPQHPRPTFVVFVVGLAAERIAGGDLDRFTGMLQEAGGLRRPPAIATEFTWSSWAFESWWDLRRFEDFLVDNFWWPETPDVEFWLQSAATIEWEVAA